MGEKGKSLANMTQDKVFEPILIQNLRCFKSYRDFGTFSKKCRKLVSIKPYKPKRPPKMQLKINFGAR